MKFVLLSSTLLLGTALAAPVPTTQDQPAPAGNHDPYDLVSEVGGIFAGSEGNGKGSGTTAGNALGLRRREDPSSTSAAGPGSTATATDPASGLLNSLGLGSLTGGAGGLPKRAAQGSQGGLDLGKTVSGLLGEGGNETGAGGLGGLKKREPQADSEIPDGDALSEDILGEVSESLAGAGVLGERTPQLNGVLGGILGGIPGVGSLTGAGNSGLGNVVKRDTPATGILGDIPDLGALTNNVGAGGLKGLGKRAPQLNDVLGEIPGGASAGSVTKPVDSILGKAGVNSVPKRSPQSGLAGALGALGVGGTPPSTNPDDLPGLENGIGKRDSPAPSPTKAADPSSKGALGLGVLGLRGETTATASATPSATATRPKKQGLLGLGMLGLRSTVDSTTPDNAKPNDIELAQDLGKYLGSGEGMGMGDM